jgi:hypothetical protein
MSIDWSAAWKHLMTLDDEEWDTESERLEDLWRAEYTTAFVAFATARGWAEENARDFASDLVTEAVHDDRDRKPKEVAEEDVQEVECECD